MGSFFSKEPRGQRKVAKDKTGRREVYRPWDKTEETKKKRKEGGKKARTKSPGKHKRSEKKTQRTKKEKKPKKST